LLALYTLIESVLCFLSLGRNLYLIIYSYATCILRCNGVDENCGENYGRARALLENVVDQIRDVGSCVWHSSSLVAVICTSVDKNEIGF
jgi:hypothetical protein